ncbi:fimbrial biogenesis chaperone [Solimicrobium silvestre]|uniref:P pilus assembly protein chaperone PapD n=1 Tax=Solimicrobium silvestre TaxID=2099400 RepID=A0A2S9H1C2_9BURK|nr:molecular chaperone [Solimicrobium silvestre]PRC93782.1 P pilus assembly protein chaperone PapD [Solimicrobium silvestre]
MRKNWKIIGSALFLSVLTMAPALASVVMTNTRVIYPANAREKSIQLTNQDSLPSVMQVWIDSGDDKSTPETAEAPFLVTPPLFRIEPNEGQTIRLVFIGEGLPQDRESVFYLNTVQIPSLDANSADQNQMIVMLRNRIKLFYRPTTIKGGIERATDQFSFSVQQEGADWRVTAENKSGYHISLVNAKVVSNAQEFPFEPSMVAPYSKADWVIKNPGHPMQLPMTVNYSFINDYGGTGQGEYKFNPDTPVTDK